MPILALEAWEGIFFCGIAGNIRILSRSGDYRNSGFPRWFLPVEAFILGSDGGKGRASQGAKLHLL